MITFVALVLAFIAGGLFTCWTLLIAQLAGTQPKPTSRVSSPSGFDGQGLA